MTSVETILLRFLLVFAENVFVYQQITSFILLLEDGRIHTFDVEPVRKTRSRWSGGNRDIHSFGDLLNFSERCPR